MNELKILIADNQNFTRVGMETILKDFYHQQVFIRGILQKDELITVLETGEFHLLIIDCHLFDFDDIRELGELRKRFHQLGILVVTETLSSEEILSVINQGISNYILKTTDEKEFIEAVIATLNNRKYLNNQILEVLLDRRTSAKPYSEEQGKLTSSELDIVRQIAQGLTNKEIAHIKRLSYHTIITHRKNIFRKLGISNSSELIMYAMRAGLIDTTEYYI